MHKFFLDPATADPSVVVFGIFCHFFCNLTEFQSEKGRGILRTTHRIQFQGNIPNLMVTKIQTKLVAFCKMIRRKIFDVIFFVYIRIYFFCFYNIYNRNRANYCLQQFRRTCFRFFYEIIIGHTDHIKINAYFCH